MSNCRAKGLPNFLHYRTGLRYLDLSHNNLGGQNPSWLLQNNTRLQQFLMEGNSFKGHLQLPKHVNVNMFQVDISGNKMRGQIPMNIGSMFPHLQILNLSRNVFEGILEELAKSGSLLTLRLSSNNLSGKIPPTMFTLDKLRQLYLDGNNFDGEMPLIDISTLSFPALSDIDLSDNHLSVELPKWIWNVPNFEALDFSNNNFYGHFPLEFCNLGLLRFLDLSQNNFSGSVPSCISSLAIEHLHLSRNRLSGPLPHALYISSLVALDLGQNNLTGKIPYWVANLSALRILVLRENHFKGEIPSQICQLNLLSIVDLSQNKLSGHIPSCLSTLTLMPTDKSFRTASTSYLLDASQDSQFVFPGSSYRYPGRYVEEQVLFTTKKGSYSYSGNLLEYMSGIDLSCNMLTGSIPYDKAQFATFDESSYLGNPFLCGPPKHENCSGTGLAPTTPNASSIEEESGFMDKHAFLVTFLASYPIVLTTIGVVLYINPYCNEDGFISSSSASTLATISLWSMFSEEAPSPMPWWFPLFLIV
ncbi:hypothetical protein ES288_A06G063800v1 [Gossypium darwinii]|uniref:Leucine-rich repeat-containing N-terminal plant-type domain-containing protein n=1 Tax=Gossypium darwinii TaxID=34276 RepID=A0A5D2G3U5_GOSDA|nr:hypothetical protein ES288_A06G063800v1 [Gossypium darwinii]